MNTQLSNILTRVGRHLALLLLLSIALGGFFFLFDRFFGLIAAGPPDLLAPGGYGESVGIPSGTGFVSGLLVAVSLLVGGGAVLLGRRSRWALALGGVFALTLFGLALLLALSGALDRDLTYAQHQVQGDGVLPLGMALLAGLFLSAAGLAMLKPRWLPVALLLGGAALALVGWSSLASLEGLHLFQRAEELEAAPRYVDLVNSYRQENIPSVDLSGLGLGGLVDSLGSGNPTVRRAAAETLGELGEAGALKPLTRALQDPDSGVRGAAAGALGDLGEADPESVQALLEALQDIDPQVRAEAARSLGRLAAARGESYPPGPGKVDGQVDPAVLAALLETLGDQDPAVRAAAAEALGDLGDPDATEALAQAITDQDPAVRAAAAEALDGLLDQGSATSPQGPGEPDPATLQNSLEALADPDAGVRDAAARLLGQSDDPQSVAALTGALADEAAQVRESAAASLGQLKSPEAVDSLAEAVNDDDPGVRAAASEALREIGIATDAGGTLTQLESGTTLVSRTDGRGLMVGTATSNQAAAPPHLPVFQVHGATRSRYLRVATGDQYADGRWRQLDPLSLLYQPPAAVPDLVRTQIGPGSAAATGLPDNRIELALPELALLAGPAVPAPAGELPAELEVVFIQPAPPSSGLPAGTLPISQHLRYVSVPGEYSLFSGTFYSPESRPGYSWRSAAARYSREELASATLSADPTYRQLPQDLPARVGQLARLITQDQTSPYDQAKAIEEFLRSQYTYRFTDPDSEPDRLPPGQDPVDWFLFDHTSGTCGNFSSAFVILARSLGIPARVVSGWAIVPSEGSQTVYSDQAHQWAEVAFADLGWVTFEPTPPGASAPSRAAEAATEPALPAPEETGPPAPDPTPVPEPTVPPVPSPTPTPSPVLPPPPPAPGAQPTATEITRWPERIRKGFPFVIEGAVRTVSGAPVDGLAVEIFVNETKEPGGEKVGEGTVTGGRFRVEVRVPADLAGGGYQLLAHAVGNAAYLDSWSDPEIGVYSGTQVELSGPTAIPVGEQAVFRGRLSEESGAAVPGREIQIRLNQEPLASRVSDQQGDFSFSHVFQQPGQQALDVEFPSEEFLLGNVAHLEVEVTVATEVVLDGTGPVPAGESWPVAGSLRDRQGNPLGGQDVLVALDGGVVASVPTDAEGRFAADILVPAPGAHLLTVRFGGAGFHTPAAAVTRFRAVEATTLDVDPPGTAVVGQPLEISGALWGSGGQPLAGQAIAFSVDGGAGASATTDATGRFNWTARFDTPGERRVRVRFPGTDDLAAASTQINLAAAVPAIVVEPLEPVARGSVVTLRGVVASGNEPLPDVPVSAGAGVTARSNQLGAFLLRQPVPADTPLGLTELELTATPLGATLRVPLEVKSATTLVVAPQGRVRSDRPSRLAVTLLDDRGQGIASAELHPPQGPPAITDEEGRAAITLEPSEGANPSVVPVRLRYEGDAANMPLDYSGGIPVTSVGLGWLRWLLLPLALLLGAAAGFYAAQRGLLRWPPFGPQPSLVTSSGSAPGVGSREWVDPGPVGQEPELPPVAIPTPEPLASRLSLTPQKVDPDLPEVWGVGETVLLECRLNGEDGRGVPEADLELAAQGAGSPLALVTDQGGQAGTSLAWDAPGEYRVSATFPGNPEFLASADQRAVRVVDFRAEIVRLYNSFLEGVRRQVPDLAREATPREMEYLVVTSGLHVDQRALEELISRFEEADYSEHQLGREQYAAMYRAWRVLTRSPEPE